MRMNEEHPAFKEMSENHLYKIGLFAQMNHMTVKALRFYENERLLIPAYVDNFTGYRYYILNQIADLHRINALKNAGFTLDDIKRINAGVDTNSFIMKKKAVLMEKIAELTRQLAALDSYLAKDNVLLNTPVLVKEIPETKVASMQKRINSYDELFDIMPDMGAEMERLGYECAMPEYCFTRYLADWDKEEDILIETCESVVKKCDDSETVKFKIIPSVTAACIFHKGSYDNLAESYNIVLKYVEENNYEICGPIRESYIDGVWNCESSKDWLTEIQVPVKKKEV